MSKELRFCIFCIELYKSAKGLNGRQAFELFEKFGVFEYISSFFEALHTTGDLYIINDIDLYIKSFNK